ncbi:MAG TPA: glycine--tRNA ligase subunit beta, partial [Hyphomonadaceae bacterium]|nr:glycine--tRNA ligase subunit beta [Hyphomonadaceae bacterium]
MPQLLLEILSEEIPARMQAKAEADLVKALMDGLSAAGLLPEGIKGFSGPRRLVAVVEGLPVKSADVVEDVIGPKEGAPDAAIQGFLKKAGLSDISQAHVHEVPKKGRVYVAHVRKPGKQTTDVIAALVPQIIRGFHWPKSMRWGTGDLRWVRPISRILCTFDGEVVPFEIEGIKSDNLTEGHRVMGRGPFKVRRFDDYEDVIKNKGRVILDREERKEIILTEAKQLCAAQNLELVDDIGLLEEVAGLAEFPVVIIGDMDKSFLDLPPEVIKLSMRTHQKYFAVRDPAKKDGGLAPKFIVVANLDAADGGEKIAAGNSRVLSARLNDARFFWDNDRKIKLEDRFSRLKNIIFHEKLGTVKDKAERVMVLAREIASMVDADPSQAELVAKLAKCDLVSDMVGEFPELEGIMGRYLYREDVGIPVLGAGSNAYQYEQKQVPDAGKHIAIAEAIRDHYKPKGQGDHVPGSTLGATVALADKLDTLSGFWAIDEKPTGSKDPFALRRAALGIIRIVLEGGYRLPLISILQQHGGVVRRRVEEVARIAILKNEVRTLDDQSNRIQRRINDLSTNDEFAKLQQQLAQIVESANSIREKISEAEQILSRIDQDSANSSSDLLAFFADRLKVHLREQGARHDLIDAVFALGEDDLVLIVKRVEALGEFLATEDGKNLLAGYKRAANILAIEEKKDGKSYSGQGAAMAGDPAEVD